MLKVGLRTDRKPAMPFPKPSGLNEEPMGLMEFNGETYEVIANGGESG